MKYDEGQRVEVSPGARAARKLANRRLPRFRALQAVSRSCPTPKAQLLRHQATLCTLLPPPPPAAAHAAACPG